MKSKYGSELWFQGRSLSQCISAKDALKFYLTQPLEALLVSKDSLPVLKIPGIRKG
jgi:tRNA pseudouridine synthase 10